MKLEIHRTFVENRDGTYDLYEMPKTPDSMDDSFKGKNPMPIRPFELKTFLKVGKCPNFDFWLQECANTKTKKILEFFRNRALITWIENFFGQWNQILINVIFYVLIAVGLFNDTINDNYSFRTTKLIFYKVKWV